LAHPANQNPTRPFFAASFGFRDRADRALEIFFVPIGAEATRRLDEPCVPI
jgi:hypothetical protein